jgi:hypothetical protein
VDNYRFLSGVAGGEIVTIEILRLLFIIGVSKFLHSRYLATSACTVAIVLKGGRKLEALGIDILYVAAM